MQVQRAWLLALPLIVAALAVAQLGEAEEPLMGARQAWIFQQSCAHCHVRPGIGVPVLGDTAEWETRRAQGFEAMVAHTVEGFADMPPLGTCSFCTEDDLRRLVAFMAGYTAVPAGGREPSAPGVEQ